MDDLQIRKAFMAVVGVEPRLADLAVIGAMGPDPSTVADYIWDHIMGEPESPTVEQVLEVVQLIAETKE